MLCEEYGAKIDLPDAAGRPPLWYVLIQKLNPAFCDVLLSPGCGFFDVIENDAPICVREWVCKCTLSFVLAFVFLLLVLVLVFVVFGKRPSLTML